MIHLVRNGAVMHDANVRERIAALLAQHMAAANILGRLQVARDCKVLTGKSVELATSSRLPRHHHFAEDDPQGEDIQAGFALDLPDDGAAAYIRNLTPVTKEIFDGLTSQYKSEAFTLAGDADQRLITEIRDKLAEVVGNGGTAEDFRVAVAQLTSEAGVAELNAWNLDVAFQIAAQKAYALGRYEQMREPTVMEVLPIWQYWTVGDDRVRPEHRVLHMFSARAEDPVWLKIYPPNGFGCRCSVVPVLESEAPSDASESGMERLPLLARLKVPPPGFGKVFA